MLTRVTVESRIDGLPCAIFRLKQHGSGTRLHYKDGRSALIWASPNAPEPGISLVGSGCWAQESQRWLKTAQH